MLDGESTWAACFCKQTTTVIPISASIDRGMENKREHLWRAATALAPFKPCQDIKIQCAREFSY